MKPVYDRRTALQGKPGTYALIIGVSAYPHLPTTEPPSSDESEGSPFYGLRSLSSTSLAAFKIYQWLLEQAENLEKPLAACWLLLSPSTDELNAEPDMDEAAPRATKDNLMEAAKTWRDASSKDPDGATFFYFAGHGVARSTNDHVLLMDEFGDGKGAALYHGVVTKDLIDGMAPVKPWDSIARTQFYFMDACRTTPEAFENYELENVGDIWQKYTCAVDDRVCPCFYATIPGKPAYSIRGDQTVFSRALLACFRGDAGVNKGPVRVDRDRGWCVTAHSLADGLEGSLKRIGTETALAQRYIVAGLGTSAILHHFPEVPLIDVSMRVVPSAARSVTDIKIYDADGCLCHERRHPISPHPYDTVLPAGNYHVAGTISPPKPPYSNFGPKIRAALPTDSESRTWLINVGGKRV